MTKPSLLFKLALAAVASTGLQASAASHFDTTAFTLDLAPGYTSPSQGLSLLSDHNGVTQFSLTGMDNLTKKASNCNCGGTNTVYDAFAIDLRANYRITGFSLTGTLTGVADNGQIPTGAHYSGVRGTGSNSFALVAAATQGQPWDNALGSARTDLPNFNGTSTLSIGSTMSDADNFTLFVSAFLSTSATPGNWQYDNGPIHEHGTTPAFAFLELQNPVLTIYSQATAVPEPSSYAMLLGGLGVLGALARRRKRQA
jgi:hypothetical protein